MKKILLILAAVLSLALPSGAYAQKFTISGVVLNKETNKPIDMAVINLPNSELWAVANDKGEFTVKNVPKGATKLTISCLGYVTKEFDIVIQRDVMNMVFHLDVSTLAIDNVVVTARENQNSMTTSRTIDRTTMDHMQMINVSDITSLLPGGTTVNPSLTSASSAKIGIREYGESSSSIGFGTGIEVDGVRITGNANFSAMTGVDTRNIASANVESIEVITGVPSVEYGDIATGVVKINTKKGRTPYMLSTTINPRTKQFALSKGFDLGKERGVLNFSVERARAISELASPYTAYDRNTATLNYSNTFNQGEDRMPLRFSIGVTGNLGGLNSEEDPDANKNDYTKTRDDNIRANTQLNWLLNKSWITSLEFSGSVSYTNREQRVNTNKSLATTTPARHGEEEGYFMAQDYETDPDAAVTLIPAGYWEELQITDDKPIDFSAQIKANWAARWGNVNSKLKIGLDYSGSGNYGHGIYYDNPKYAAESWRPDDWSEDPFMHNIAAYIEESLTIPIGSTSLDLVAGLRNDNTVISESIYGTVSSLSPRFNVKYTVFDGRFRKKGAAFRSLSFRAGWGKMVKLPSSFTLYPSPVYNDTQVFASPATSDGSSYVAYYMQPTLDVYNPNLKWQHTNQTEVGVDFNLYGVQVSLSAFYNKTVNPYIVRDMWSPYSYTLTTIQHLNGCPIPVDNRIYSIDRQTGHVTVTDKTGTLEPYNVTYDPNGKDTKNLFRGNKMADNGSDYTRAGLEWVVDFGQIRPLRTDIRVDGAFNYYKHVEQSMMAYYRANSNGADGQPLQYIGWYVGPSASANGTLSKQVNLNLTLTTHIPKIRTIVSVRLESSLYRFSQKLSEWDGGTVSYAIDGKDPQNDPIIGQDISEGGHYVVTYPAYYSSFDNPDEMIPFFEAYQDAKQNDPALYSDLTQLITVSGNNYYFRPSKTSAYCALNISVTKEIGKIASLSFYANNCFNNMGRVHISQNDTYLPLYKSSYIQNFYYGVSLRLKF